ncbi:hypothetical protein [Streptomyces canarius]
MIRALTGFSTRHAWKVIALWAVLGLALGALSPMLLGRVTQSQTGDFLPKSYDSAAALRIAEEEFGVKPDATTVTVLVARSDGKALTGGDQRRIEAEAAKASAWSPCRGGGRAGVPQARPLRRPPGSPRR